MEYNDRNFLVRNSIKSCASYHAKIVEYQGKLKLMFRVNDCNKGALLLNNATIDELPEMIEKLYTLANGAINFAKHLELELFRLDLRIGSYVKVIDSMESDINNDIVNVRKSYSGKHGRIIEINGYKDKHYLVEFRNSNTLSGKESYHFKAEHLEPSKFHERHL